MYMEACMYLTYPIYQNITINKILTSIYIVSMSPNNIYNHHKKSVLFHGHLLY